jgi:autotransporter-associated beta strand protein
MRVALAGLVLALAHSAHAADIGWNQTGAGTFGYGDQANWVDGNINGLWDASLVLTSAQTVTFDADTVLTTGLTFRYDGGFNPTLRGAGGDRTLTLGGDIVVDTVSTTRTINLGGNAGQNLNVDLGGVTRTLGVASGRTLGFVNVISNGGIVMNGGTVNFSGANTYTGTTTVNSGNLSLNGAAGGVAGSDITLRANTSNSTTTLTFNNSSSGVSGTNRAKSVALQGAGHSNGVALNVSGNSGADSVDTIANAVSAVSGFSTMTLSANAARNLRLEAGSFVRNAGTTVLFRGSDLGVSPIAAQTAGDANLQFGTVTLSGGDGVAGQTNIGIIKGAYGDVVSNGAGSGLVTHDSTHGVRLLDFATEYQATIADGQNQADNVRFARASGDPAPDINLTAPETTINSLSFRITGAGTNSGVTISGDVGTTLRLESGMIFASQAVTAAAATDAMTISVPTLDLNGQEGVLVSFTAGVNNGNTPAPLLINSSIGNDGGNGVTIGGTGEVIFGGSTAHTYTGVTTINSGILRLNKTVANSGIPGDLVMNGGILLKNNNAIPDTASVTLNAGTFWFDSTTSSGNNNHVETLLNFTLNGGVAGHHGSNAVLNINGNATVNVGDLSMNQGGDLTVLGTTALNGGRLMAREASSTTVQNAVTTLNHLAIQNTASSAYTAVVLNSHPTNQGSRLILNGDLTFTGNATNPNTTRIDSSDGTLANQGVIALNGTRTFAIGNGAADVDVTIVPALTDNGANAGGLLKTGPGVLAILGANTYTGPTNVDSGTLVISGSLNGTAMVTVADGATLSTDEAATVTLAMGGGVMLDGTLSPGGAGSHGTFTLEPGVGGTLTFGSASTLALDLNLVPTNADRVRFGTAGDWLGGSGTATLTLGGAVDYGATYTVFENALTVGFTFAAITGYDTLNYSAELTQAGSDYVLSFEAIPEPGLGGLLLGGFGVLVGTRRMRGRPIRSNASSGGN